MVVARWGEVRRQAADPGLILTFLGVGVILVAFGLV